MKAAVLKSFGSPLVIESLADPGLGTGEVIVDVAASAILPYSSEVFSGARNYLLDLPAVPGPSAIGRVRAVGPDATHLKPGDWVYCDPTVRSRDNVLAPDITLLGWSARGDGGMKLQRHFRHGCWAEQVRVPTENAQPIGPIEARDAAAWCALGVWLVPYGGWVAANLQPGESVLVSGATGNFGSAAVAVALAIGASWVIAPGRNEIMLAELVRRFGPRVIPVKLSGNEADDRQTMMATAPGPIDCVMDILPPQVATTTVRAALMAVRQNGRIVLMGGVGMLGGAGLELPYPWIMRNGITIHGAWMYPREVIPRMVGLARAGLLDLSQFSVTEFPLERVNEAVAHAATHGGPFTKTVLKPG